MNYHHLYYFWVVAREGSITKACATLNLAQPTISAQIASLEDSLGVPLFLRRGRKLILTDAGKITQGYANNIFLLGKELRDVIKSGAHEKPLELKIGIIDSVAKVVAYNLIEPALRSDPELKIVCREGTAETLLAALAIHDLDMVISDAPAPSSIKLQSYSHLLGESEMSAFASIEESKKLIDGFPHSLNSTSVYLPLSQSQLRQNLDRWFQEKNITPHIRGEIQDLALLKLIASTQGAVFFAPSAAEKKIEERYAVKAIGKISEVRESYYGISIEKKLKHPAILVMSEASRKALLRAA